MLKKLAKMTLATAALILIAQEANAALAKIRDVAISVPNTTPIVLEVTGKDGHYDTISSDNLVMPIHGEARVKNASLKFKILLAHVRVHQPLEVDIPFNIPLTSYEQSFLPAHYHPRKFDETNTMHLPLWVLGGHKSPIIDVCNTLVSEGASPDEDNLGQYTLPLRLRVRAGKADSIGSTEAPFQKFNTKFADTSATINVKCKAINPPPGTAGGFDFDPGAFKVLDMSLSLATSTGPDAETHPNPATTCKKGRIRVALKTNQAGLASIKLSTSIAGAISSKDVFVQAEPDGNGGFEAEHIEWVSVNKSSNLLAKAEEVVGAGEIGKDTPWKELMLQCKSAGEGGGIATNPNPGNPNNPNGDGLPQFKTLKGDFLFVDHGSPKCDRIGKALVTFQSPKSDNIHFSLDCKDENHSGVVPVVPNPAGGYMAVKLVSFDVKKTYTEACTLRTVAPYGPKDHVSKIHLFQCVTPSGHSASNDVQVPSNPPSAKPNVPATLIPTAPQKAVASCPVHQKLIFTQVERHGILYDTTKCVDRDLKPWPAGQSPDPQVKGIVGTGSSSYPVPPWRCVGGSFKNNDCICRTGWKPVPWSVKDHGILRHGEKCVPAGPGNKTTVPVDPSVKGLVIAKPDAEKRRLQAAKDAAIAKRKRDAAIAKHKRDAAIAKARKRKAAQEAAIAKRKRDAAAALAKRKAAAALAQRKAATALVKRRAAAAALAQRKSAAASLARRRNATKKRAAPSTSNSVQQFRAFRRR